MVMPLYDAMGNVICIRCNKHDRVIKKDDTPTDFGGLVEVWVCLRCGIVALGCTGERPSLR